ncbi:MAG: hypothetical protein ACTSPY_14080 [Candidatus Helarchaeota archaeon]
MLNKLLESPSKRFVKIITIGSLILFIILTIVFQIIQVNTNATPYGVIDFELAFTAQTISIIFNVWNTNPIIFQEQFLGVYLDWFLYIPAYTLAIAGTMILLTRNAKGKLQKFSLYLILIPFIAAICDVIENFGLISMLNNKSLYLILSAPDTIPFVTSIFASLKFILLLISIIVILSVLIINFIRNRKK